MSVDAPLPAKRASRGCSFGGRNRSARVSAGHGPTQPAHRQEIALCASGHEPGELHRQLGAGRVHRRDAAYPRATGENLRWSPSATACARFSKSPAWTRFLRSTPAPTALCRLKAARGPVLRRRFSQRPRPSSRHRRAAARPNTAPPRVDGHVAPTRRTRRRERLVVLVQRRVDDRQQHRQANRQPGAAIDSIPRPGSRSRTAEREPEQHAQHRVLGEVPRLAHQRW